MCYHPIQAARLFSLSSVSGKRKIVTKRSELELLSPNCYERINLPCGRCIACRLKYSKDWAIRIVGESKSYENKNCFITLTFNDYMLPKNGSLDVVYFQKFMKRLRKRFGNGIRFYHCGEYGEKFKRPHFHACIFNHVFDDIALFKQEDGISLYRSPELERLWRDPVSGLPYGYSTVGELTFDSAAYVARYCTKKVNGKLAIDHYKLVLSDDTVTQLKPEYATMSRNPGIGRDYYEAYKKEIYVTDSIVLPGGVEVKPPRYYNNLYEIECPSDYARVKEARLEWSAQFSYDSTPERLEVREKVHLAKAKLLIRNFEQGNV